MKITLQRENLLKPLQMVNGVVEKRQTLPILSNLLLVASDKTLTLTGTDMEVELIASIPLSKKTEGQTTIPARKLLDICRTLPDEASISLELDKDKAVIRSGTSRFSLATLPADDFPSLEDIDTSIEFSVPQADLKDLIQRTHFAMAQQDVRYYLNGLMLEIRSGLLRAVATDGHRLSMFEIDAELDVPDILQIIVPRKGIMELLRLLDDTDTPVTIGVSSNHIQVNMPEVRFTSKLIDGRFPDYGRVVPDENTGDILVAEKEVLRQGLARTSILSNEKYRGVRLNLETDQIKALAHNPEQEEAEEVVGVEYKGNDMEIGFNVNYLLDAINAIDTDNVMIRFYDANSSCLVRADNDNRARYVVMPMRL